MVDGRVRVQFELLGEPISVGEARRLVVRTLLEWDLPHLEEVATLLVSEVVTNAVLHARTGLALELRLQGPVLRITVSDGSPRQPLRRHNSLESSTGRGIGLVETLANEWGTGPGHEPWQKDVWFELAAEPGRLREPADGALDPA